MDSLVLDVSACMPWCCEDEATAASEKTLPWAIHGSTLRVPSLWPWEMMKVTDYSGACEPVFRTDRDL
jgi:hypothetical protein